MLKTLSTKLAEPRKGGAGLGGDSRARRDKSEIDKCEMDDVEVDDGKVRDDEIKKKGQKDLSPKICLSVKKR